MHLRFGFPGPFLCQGTRGTSRASGHQAGGRAFPVGRKAFLDQLTPAFHKKEIKGSIYRHKIHGKAFG